MKLKRQIYAILSVSALFMSGLVHADDRSVEGVMGVMRMMQQQSGANADPNSQAIMEGVRRAMESSGHNQRGQHSQSQGQRSGGQHSQSQGQRSGGQPHGQSQGQRSGGQPHGQRSGGQHSQSQGQRSGGRQPHNQD